MKITLGFSVMNLSQGIVMLAFSKKDTIYINTTLYVLCQVSGQNSDKLTNHFFLITFAALYDVNKSIFQISVI